MFFIYFDNDIMVLHNDYRNTVHDEYVLSISNQAVVIAFLFCVGWEEWFLVR